MSNYDKWLLSPNVSEEDKKIIKSFSAKEVEKHFGKPLIFGTAGIRTHMGLGSSLLNKYIIKQITYAWIRSLEKNFPEDLERPLMVSHDTRRNSDSFADIAAEVISGMGYEVHMIYENRAVPTPISSFGIRDNNFGGGCTITASHNPAVYNGYKIFDGQGRHLVTERTDAIAKELEKVDINTAIPSSRDNIKFLGENYEEFFVESIANSLPLQRGNKNIKIAFSPLHGASYKLAPMMLRYFGFDVTEEPLQSIPDSNFTHTKSPNPEDLVAFERLEVLGREIKADVLLSSDPDGDRVGVSVWHDDKYNLIGGHDLASLLTDYMLMKTKETKGLNDETIIKTIVTTSLVDQIAESYGVNVINTLTGFKYIGEKASEMSKKPLLATEESYGASISLELSYDKDSVQILPIFADMVDYYKKQGKTLIDVIQELYLKYTGGVVRHYNQREELEGDRGIENLPKLINKIAELETFGSIAIDKIVDFKKDKTGLPWADLVMVYFGNEGKSWFAVRPSGTEPLMRKYYCIFDKDEESIDKTINEINNVIQVLKEEVDNAR